MSVFVHAQGIKTVHAGWVGKKWQNSVHVVVECPLYVVCILILGNCILILGKYVYLLVNAMVYTFY